MRLPKYVRTLVCGAVLAGCTPWTVEVVEDGPPGSTEEPAPIAGVDDAGHALMVWHREDGVRASSYDPEGGWSAPQLLGPGRFPDLGMTPSGIGYAAWTGGQTPFVSRHDGTGWASPTSPAFSGLANYIAVDVGATDEALVVWAGPDGVHAATRTATRTGPTVQLAAVGATDVVVDVAESGRGIAAWCQSAGTGVEVWASPYDGGFAGAEKLGDGCGTSPYGAVLPKITAAVAADGTAHVAWSGGKVYARTFVPGSGWTILQTLGEGFMPRMAVNASGDGLVGWSAPSSGGHLDIQARSYGANTGFGSKEVVATSVGPSGARVAMASDGSGWLMFLSPQDGAIGNDPSVAPYSTSDGFEPAYPLAQPDGTAYYPDIAASPKGSAVAAWQGAPGRWIEAAVFHADG